MSSQWMLHLHPLPIGIVLSTCGRLAFVKTQMFDKNVIDVKDGLYVVFDKGDEFSVIDSTLTEEGKNPNREDFAFDYLYNFREHPLLHKYIKELNLESPV